MASWKPGTTRWACLQITIYTALLAVDLPITISANTGAAWTFFALLMAGGIGNIAAAFILHRNTRRTKATAATAAPRR